MKRTPWFAWLFVAVWATWFHGLQSALVARDTLAVWVPDMALVLCVALAAKIDRRDWPWAALAFGAARCATSIDAPVACMTAAFATLLLASTTRGVLELSRPLPRAVLAASMTLGTQLWFALVQVVRSDTEAQRSAAEQRFAFDFHSELWNAAPSVLSTAVAAFVLGGVVARLPGLLSISRRRRWHVTASSH